MKSLNITAISLMILALIGPGVAHSQPSIFELEKQVIPNAINVQISPKGRELFRKHLELVLYYAAGIGDGSKQITESFSELGWNRSMDRMITRRSVEFGLIDSRRIVRPQYEDMIDQSLSIMNALLLASPLAKVHPRINSYDLDIDMDFKHLGVKPRKEVTINGRRGVIFDVTARAKSIKSFASEVVAEDLAQLPEGEDQLYIKPIRLKGLQIYTTPQSPDFELTVPVFISVSPEGGIEYQVLEMQSNMGNLRMSSEFEEFDFGGNEFEFSMNGHSVVMIDQKEMESFFVKYRNPLIGLIKTFMTAGMHEHAPAFINKIIKERMLERLQRVNYLNPPRPPKTKIPRGQDYLWGLELSNLFFENEFLEFSLGSYMEDRQAEVSVPLDPDMYSTGAPVPNKEMSKKHDATVFIDQAMINRILQLGFNRGYFYAMDFATAPVNDEGESLSDYYCEDPKERRKKRREARKRKGMTNAEIEAEEARNKGLKISLARVPKVKILSNNQVKLDLQLVYNPSSIHHWVGLKNDTIIDLKMDLELVHSSQGGIGVKMKRITDYSIDDRYIKKWWFIADNVKKSVHANLQAMIDENNCRFLYQTEQEHFIQNINTPAAIAGIPLKLKAVDTDPNGHLVFYLDYGDM